MTYVYLMANKKSLNLEIIKKHVQYLKKLDDLVIFNQFNHVTNLLHREEI